MSEQKTTVLVTGATGKVGRHVVNGLRDRGVHVRALVRRPIVAGLPDDVEVVEGDLTKPETVAAAAVGADAGFLLWPSFSADGAAEVIDALASYVPHLVYVSAALLQAGREGPMPGVWADVEQLIERSEATSTFVRAGGFAANTLQWAEQTRSGDVVQMTFPEAARSLVHERDIADVSVHALLEPEHIGRAYEVTGPEVLTQAAQLRSIADAVGRDLRLAEQSPQEALAAAEPEARGFLAASQAHWATLVDDPELAKDDVERVTGHPARTFAQWAAEHAHEFTQVSAAQVAHNYAEGFRGGDIARATSQLASEVVRIAPLETGGERVEVRGLDAIMENAQRQNENLDIEHVEVSEPYLGDTQFAIRFDFTERNRVTGQRHTTTKMSLCTVEDGLIVREEVFYHSSPHTPD